MKEKILKALKWFVIEFCSKVLMEFIWLLFSVSLGIYIVTEAVQLDSVQVDKIINTYGRWLVMVLFNAAALRIVMAIGLDWLDKRLEGQNAERQAMIDQAKMGIKLAVHTALGKPIITGDETEGKDG